MGHQDVLGVEGGLLVGWKGGMGRGRNADQRLQWKGVAEQATGGSETVDATKGQRGQGMSPCLTPLQDISLYTAGPVQWVPYNQGRPGRHGSPLPGGLTMATVEQDYILSLVCQPDRLPSSL